MVNKSKYYACFIFYEQCFSLTVDLLVVFVPDIRLVFGLAGATCASMLVIILPSMFYIRIIPGTNMNPKKIVVIVLYKVFKIIIDNKEKNMLTI